jgi:hypothetical protein
MNCNKIRTMIDEADGQGNIPFEAARHIQTCKDCNRFADERAKLFEVLNSVGRITAPSDFQVALRRRLRERTAAQPAPWYAQAFNMKLAGAFAAAVICAVIAVQFVGFRGLGHDQTKGLIAQVGPQSGTQDNPTVKKDSGPSSSPGQVTVTGPSPKANLVHVASPKPHIGRERTDELATAIREDMLPMPADLILVRGKGAEQRMVVPPVTVGSQPPYYLDTPASNTKLVSF